MKKFAIPFFVLALVFVGYVIANIQNTAILGTTTQVQPTSTQPPTEISTSTPIPYKPAYIAPTTDPDPIINCNTKSQGTINIKRSACSASVDCLINGKYYLAKNNDECNTWVKQADQTKTTNNSNNTYSTVQPNKFPIIIPTTDNSKYNSCMQNAQQSFNSCGQTCLQQQQDQSQSGEYNRKQYQDCNFNCEQQKGTNERACQ